MRCRRVSVKLERTLELDMGCATRSGVFPLPSGERVRVRGFLNCIPEAQNDVSERFQSGSSRGVLLRLHRVLPAIKFDDHPGRLATEVDDIRSNRHLAPKFQSLQPPV